MTVWLSPLVALFGALLSAVFASLAFWQARRVQRAQAHREINAQYDRVVQFRAVHPEVLKTSRSWRRGDLARVYRQAGTEDQTLVLYYTYVELALGFCNAVLYARERRLLDREAFEHHYQPLLTLILTEHYPIVSQLAASGPFVSKWVREFLEAREHAGWDWQVKYEGFVEGAILKRKDLPS